MVFCGTYAMFYAFQETVSIGWWSRPVWIDCRFTRTDSLVLYTAPVLNPIGVSSFAYCPLFCPFPYRQQPTSCPWITRSTWSSTGSSRCWWLLLISGAVPGRRFSGGSVGKGPWRSCCSPGGSTCSGNSSSSRFVPAPLPRWQLYFVVVEVIPSSTPSWHHAFLSANCLASLRF